MKLSVIATLVLITFSVAVAISQVMQSKDFRKTAENAIESLTGKMSQIAGILQAKYITKKHGNTAAPGDRELTDEEILQAQNLLQTKFYGDIQWPQNETQNNEIDTTFNFKSVADGLPMPFSEFFHLYHMNKVLKSLDSKKNNPFYPLYPLRIDEVPLPDDIAEYEDFYDYENDYPEQVTNQNALLKELHTDLTEDRSEIDPLLDIDYSANKHVETRHHFPAELKNINLDNGKPTQNTVTDSLPLFDQNKPTATQNTMLSQETITKSHQNYPFGDMKEKYGILIRPYFINENTAKKIGFNIRHSKGDYMNEMSASNKPNELKILFENKRGDSEKIDVPAFHPWGGKRSENDMSSEFLYKRTAAAKTKNEKEKFYSWGGKRDRATSYLIPSQLQTKGYRIPRSQVRKVEIPKRVTFHSWGGKRAKPDTAVGGSGPEASKVPFSAWGGKRYSSSDVIVERDQPAAQQMDLN